MNQAIRSVQAEERRRIGEILSSPEARGRQALARELALRSDLEPTVAKFVLKVAGRRLGGVAAAGRGARL